MEEVPTTVKLPQWLIDAATSAAHRQGMAFEAMVPLVIYEYAEKHAREMLSVTQEHIPAIVRLANSVMVSAIQKGASAIRLIPQIDQLSIVVVVKGNSEELTRYPNHIIPQLYDRLITMASNGVGIRQPPVGFMMPGLIPVTSRGHHYDVLLEWSGSYQRDMILQIEEKRPMRKTYTGIGGSEEAEAAETAIIGYVTQIVTKHFAQAGRDLHLDARPISYWFLYGVRLYSALIPHTEVLNDPHSLAFLRGLFAELFDYLMYAYEGEPASVMAELYWAFGASMDCEAILPRLLPERAGPVMVKMEAILAANHEEEMRRQDQMGY